MMKRFGKLLVLGVLLAVPAFGAGWTDRVEIGVLDVAARITGEEFRFDLSCTASGDRIGAEAPLVSGNVALLTSPAGKGWRLRYDAGQKAYMLVLDEGSGDVTVKASFVAKAEKDPATPNWRTVGFELPSGRVRQITVEADRKDLELRLPDVVQLKREEKGEGLTFSGILTPGRPLAAWWQAKVAEVEAKLLLASEANTIITMSPGALRLDTLFAYDISQGKLQVLRFGVPAGLSVTQVRGEHVQDWHLTEDKGARTLVVRLNRKLERQYRLQVLGEMPLKQLPAEADIPVLQPLDGTRADGFLALGTDSAIQLQVKTSTGLSQIDPAAFPRTSLSKDQTRPLPGGKAFFYSFAATPYQAHVALADIVPSYDTEHRLTITVRDDDLTIDGELEFEVRDAPIRRLEMQLPAGFVVANLSGQLVKDHSVRDSREGSGKDLEVEFREPVIGRGLIQFRLEMGKSPLGATQEITHLNIPGARNQRGFIAVASDRGVLIEKPQAEKLRQVHTRSVPMRVANAQFAWRFREAGWRLGLPVKERPAAIRAEAFHLLSLGDGIAYGSVTLTYFISGAPVDELRFNIPETLSNVEFIGLDVNRWTNKDGLWTVKLGRKVIGDYNLGITYSQRFEEGGTVSVGGIVCDGVETETGFLSVASHLNLEIMDVGTDPALIWIGHDETPSQYRLLVSSPILRSYKFVSTPHQLQVKVSAYARGATPAVIVEFVSAQTYVSLDEHGKSESVTRVRYTIKNSSAQFLNLSIPEGLKVWATRLVEKDASGTETTSRVASASDKGLLKIPLKRQRNPNAPITVEVEYGQVHGKLGWSGKLGISLPPCLVRSTYADWRVQVPQGWAVGPAAAGSMGATVPVQSRIVWFLRELMRGWIRALTRGGPAPFALIVAGVGIAIALIFRQRWVMRTAAGVLLLALLLAGLVAMHEARSLWRRSPVEQSVTFTQVLDLDEATPMSVSVHVVPAWRQHLSLPVSIGLVVLGAAAFVQAFRVKRGRPICVAAGAAALLLFALQFAIGTKIAAHALTWGLPILLFLPLLGAARRAGPMPAAVAAVLGLVLLGTTPDASAKSAPPQCVPWPAVELSRDTRIEHVDVTVDVQQQNRVGDRKESLVLGLELTLSTKKSMLLPIAPSSGMLLSVPTAPGVRLSTERGAHMLDIPPGDHKLAVKLLFPLPDRAEGEPRTFRMPLPPALSNKVVFLFPEKGWEVEAPDAVFLKTTETDARTEVEAIWRPHAALAFTWKPRGRRTKLEKTVFYAHVTSLARADSGLVEGLHRLRLRVAQGELSRVVVQVPENMTVTRVEGEQIGSWRFDPNEHSLYVGMDNPITADYEMTVRSQITAASMPYEAKIRPITVADSSRQHGELGIVTSSAVTLVVQEHSQRMNIDDFRREAAPLLRMLDGAKTSDVLHAYRLAAADAVVGIEVNAVTPELRTTETASFSVADERLVFNTAIQLEIAKSGVFWIDIELPEGYDVDSLTCDGLSHWDETEPGADGPRLARVHFQKQLLGTTNIVLALSRAVGELPPSILVPRTGVVGVLKHRGQLAIAAERGVRLSVAERDGVSELDVARMRGRSKPALAFKLLRPAWLLRLESEVVAPRVSVDFLHLAEVSDGIVKHKHYLRYRFQNAGAKTFELQLTPDALGLLISGPEIARKELVDPEKGLWRVELTGKWYDRPYPLEVNYETRFNQENGQVKIQPLAAVGADLQRGYVTVRTTARVELASVTASAALQPAEARSVPTKFGAGELADAAFCYTSPSADYELVFTASRHDAAQVLQAEVTQAALTTVISRQKDSIHQVKLTLRAGGKRHLRVKLPEGASIWSLLVDRQSRTPSFAAVATEDGGFEGLLIPLPQSADTELTVDVDLIYVIPRPAKVNMSRYDYQGPQFDLPLRNITWAFYVPEGYEYDDFDGTLTPDKGWTERPQISRYDIQAYELDNQRVMAEDLQKAVQLQKQGMQLARKGNQKAARQALSQAFNYSMSDKSLNEDARVNLRRLLKQQAVVGLVGRRGEVRQIDQGQMQQPGVALGESFTQEEAERLQGALSKDDSENLDRITNRIIDMQEAAARVTLQLMVQVPLHGRVLAFRRPLQVERNAEMRVAFKAKKKPSRSLKRTMLWVVGLVLFLAVWLSAAPWCRRGLERVYAAADTEAPVDDDDDAFDPEYVEDDEAIDDDEQTEEPPPAE